MDELFKFIKQHLRIKSFYGTSENAVKTQIWIAVSTYVLVAIVRKHLRLEASFYQILQILSLTLFEKMPILRALEATDSQHELGGDANQLICSSFNRTVVMQGIDLAGTGPLLARRLKEFSEREIWNRAGELRRTRAQQDPRGCSTHNCRRGGISIVAR